ncbi:MAG: glucose 1-dehydrogenase [Gammaproteobacteria bacterium]|nr:glucose 1-dehydrogenase [Gammaproteobacteria bacterium]
MNLPLRRRFEGKIAIVTGGSAGIGLATARAFAAEGAKVVIAARRREPGEAAAREIRASGGEATFIAADMTDPAAVRALVDAALATYGGLDIAYNNAGMTGDTATPIDQADPALFDEVIATNVRGVWLCTKYQFAAMRERGGGAIVICGSTASIRGGAGRASAYYTSKHALLGLVRNAALDGAACNIRVNAVLPGLVMTELTKQGFASDPSKLEFFRSRIPMARAGEPEEIAKAVLFLASDDASYITGAALSVDGGISI